jgi:capsular polysaccharide export protein
MGTLDADDPVLTEPAEAAVLGFSPRKRRLLQGFLPKTRLRPVRGSEQVRAGETVVVWASSPQASAVSTRSDLTVLRAEDGFLRSVGLGARLTRPLSWVVDSRGIYYDPRRASDLEHLLQTRRFEPALLASAARLRERIVAARVSKYNVGNDAWPGLSVAARGRRVVLATGQVETDASLRAGAGAVRSNMALLAAARATHPDAWLVYKPHPDVVAGLRNAGLGEDAAATVCDEIVTDAPVDRLIELADAVHVITSLTGFEALLRGKAVHCHGLPFYAGWGLTADSTATPRRTRRLSLDELVAAVLLLYPRYVSRTSGRPCTAEQALDELIAWRRADDGRMRWWQQLLRPVLHHD